MRRFPSNLGRTRTSATCPVTRGERPSLLDVLLLLPEQLRAMKVRGGISVRTDRRINWIILVCRGGEYILWESDPSAPGRPDLPKAY